MDEAVCAVCEACVNDSKTQKRTCVFILGILSGLYLPLSLEIESKYLTYPESSVHLFTKGQQYWDDSNPPTAAHPIIKCRIQNVEFKISSPRKKSSA